MKYVKNVVSRLTSIVKGTNPTIVESSNVIQFDVMGYPLRLCIFSDGKQKWIDTYEREGDVILKWEKIKS